MWIFSFKKTPEEILQDKYLELIEVNGIDKLQYSPPWFRYEGKEYFSGNISWVQWVWILVWREWRTTCNYSSMGSEETTTYTYGWSIWKIECSSSFAEQVWDKVYKTYQVRQEELKEENERSRKKQEEELQLKKDKMFIEEYNRLCWSTWEFNKQFKLLDEIESLGKEQIKLLEKWEENKELIYKKREQFYSLNN